MAGVKGKSGRHESDIKREGYFFRLRPEVIARVKRCTPFLIMQEGVRMSKAEALEHLLTIACEAVEETGKDKGTPVPAHAPISKISSISGEDISVPGYGFPEDAEETPRASQPHERHCDTSTRDTSTACA